MEEEEVILSPHHEEKEAMLRSKEVRLAPHLRGRWSLVHPRHNRYA